MKKMLFILLSVSWLLTSCVSMSGLTSIDMKMRDLEIGMTRSEVISIMGNDYQIVHNDGETVVLGYENLQLRYIYLLSFEDNHLKDWTKQWISTHDDCTHNNSSSFINKNNSGTRAHLDAHRNAMLSGANSDAEKTAINAHMDAHSKAVLGQ